jgi:hypothetical protein
MTEHQKLAALILRIIGAGWTVLIIIGLSMIGIESALGVQVRHYPTHTIIGNITYIVMGVLLVLLSKPLGKLLGRGLE